MTHAPIRVALIGAGMISDAHARAMAELCQETNLALVYSRTESRARHLAGQHGVGWTTDLSSVWERRDIDAVVVVTAPYNHAPHAIAAMKLGKHVLVEKPLAISPVECDAVLDAARRHGRTLAVVHQSRLKKSVARLKQFVDSGQLGKLIHISGYVKWYRPQSYYDANDWRGHVKTEGGGVIFSQAGHTLDLMQWIGGPVEWVFANMVTAPVHAGIDIENLGVVTMRFASGAVGMLEASTALYPGTQDRLEVHGTRGSIILEAGHLLRADLIDGKFADEPDAEISNCGADPMASPITWHKQVIADFVDAIHAGRPPAVTGGEARKLVDLCSAIYESALRLTPVRMG